MTTYRDMSLAARPRLAADYDIPRNVVGREPGVVEWSVAAVKNDKIGLTSCDKSVGRGCCGRKVKCAAGGGDGGRIGGELERSYEIVGKHLYWHF